MKKFIKCTLALGVLVAVSACATHQIATVQRNYAELLKSPECTNPGNLSGSTYGSIKSTSRSMSCAERAVGIGWDAIAYADAGGTSSGPGAFLGFKTDKQSQVSGYALAVFAGMIGGKQGLEIMETAANKGMAVCEQIEKQVGEYNLDGDCALFTITPLMQTANRIVLDAEQILVAKTQKMNLAPDWTKSFECGVTKINLTPTTDDQTLMDDLKACASDYDANVVSIFLKPEAERGWEKVMAKWKLTDSSRAYIATEIGYSICQLEFFAGLFDKIRKDPPGDNTYRDKLKKLAGERAKQYKAMSVPGNLKSTFSAGTFPSSCSTIATAITG